MMSRRDQGRVFRRIGTAAILSALVQRDGRSAARTAANQEGASRQPSWLHCLRV